MLAMAIPYKADKYIFNNQLSIWREYLRTVLHLNDGIPHLAFVYFKMRRLSSIMSVIEHDRNKAKLKVH